MNSAARKLAVLIKFQIVTIIKVIASCDCHSPYLVDLASVGILVQQLLLDISVVEPAANSCFHEQKVGFLHALIHYSLNCRDVTPKYSLNLWKFPGHFPYGLGTRSKLNPPMYTRLEGSETRPLSHVNMLSVIIKSSETMCSAFP